MSLRRVVATGRSDYPNQINNVLCFPGLFRGMFDVRALRVTEAMKIAAARGHRRDHSRGSHSPGLHHSQRVRQARGGGRGQGRVEGRRRSRRRRRKHGELP